jgi:hypothetical protein
MKIFVWHTLYKNPGSTTALLAPPPHAMPQGMVGVSWSIILGP